MTKKLPNIAAFIHEVMRYNPVAPTTIPHLAQSTIVLNDGTIIPKNSVLLGFILYINRRDTQFKNPREFDINNFLTEEGEFEGHPMVNFGIGPRSCIGEKLARVELLVFLVYLMKNFKFLPLEGETYDRNIGFVGSTQGPKPFSVELVLRN